MGSLSKQISVHEAGVLKHHPSSAATQSRKIGIFWEKKNTTTSCPESGRRTHPLSEPKC